MACRLPGGIDSPELLWKALLRGDDLITEVPPDRWDCDEFYDPQPGVPGRTVCKWGGFLDNPADFDCEFFGIGEREAIAIDPHRLETSDTRSPTQHRCAPPTPPNSSICSYSTPPTTTDHSKRNSWQPYDRPAPDGRRYIQG